ncbi:MAG: hypothetical protein JSW42_07365 [Chloroflexota bacterium]|jgi:CubicO group peptidase (beta-lactamase class C family)|nr:MAG: hypothetical protein JSW42_07365 [Chloroflexota bacterium]
MKYIEINGARIHNLKDINVSIPKDKLVVFSAVGQGGQHIFCIPEKDLVVVVASKTGSRWRDRWSLLEDFVIPAVVE